MKSAKLWILILSFCILIGIIIVIRIIPAQLSRSSAIVGALIGVVIGILGGLIGTINTLRKLKLSGKSFKIKDVSKPDLSKIFIFLIGYFMLIVGFILNISNYKSMASIHYEIFLVGIILTGLGGWGLIASTLNRYLNK